MGEGTLIIKLAFIELKKKKKKDLTTKPDGLDN